MCSRATEASARCAIWISDAADAGHVELAAETFQEMRQAQRHVRKFGMLIRSVDKLGNSHLTRNPAVGTEQRARELLRKFLGDLYLRPSARAPLGSGEGEEPDEFEQLLSG